MSNIISLTYFISTDINECASQPCMNEGTCIEPQTAPDYYYCSCVDGFEGQNCEKGLSYKDLFPFRFFLLSSFSLLFCLYF